MEIDTSLLRERFVIEEQCADDQGSALSICAMSNRIVLDLQSGTLPKESFIIRTNTMHSCARFAARMIDNYERSGPIMPRIDTIAWFEIWDDIQSDYDKRYHEESWCALYYKGKMLYSVGEYHGFFDVIEQCDARSHNNYKKAIPMAVDAFKQAGKDIDIDYDSNVALVAAGNTGGGRCSMLLRGAGSKSTFNMNLKPAKNEKLNVTQLLSSAADFLEGTQLCFTIGEITEKVEQDIIQKYSDEDRKSRHAREQLGKLHATINSMENLYQARYRPERPDFDLLVEASEKETREVLYNLDESGYVD